MSPPRLLPHKHDIEPDSQWALNLNGDEDEPFPVRPHLYRAFSEDQASALRRTSLQLPQRDSFTARFRDSLSRMLREHSRSGDGSSLRRWASVRSILSPTSVNDAGSAPTEVPLKEANPKAMCSNARTATSNKSSQQIVPMPSSSSSYLPKLSSTPPMPTFQKPVMKENVLAQEQASQSSLNAATKNTIATRSPSMSALPTSSVSPSDTGIAVSLNNRARPDSSALPPIADPGNLLGLDPPNIPNNHLPSNNPSSSSPCSSSKKSSPATAAARSTTANFSHPTRRDATTRPTIVGTPPSERLPESPPLPPTWSDQHDRAICVLDARNYPLQMIVAKLRRVFPGLKGILTPGMIDRRLRVLDQVVEIDYWRVGLEFESGRGGGDGEGQGRGQGVSGDAVVDGGQSSGVMSAASGDAGAVVNPGTSLQVQACRTMGETGDSDGDVYGCGEAVSTDADEHDSRTGAMDMKATVRLLLFCQSHHFSFPGTVLSIILIDALSGVILFADSIDINSQSTKHSSINPSSPSQNNPTSTTSTVADQLTNLTNNKTASTDWAPRNYPRSSTSTTARGTAISLPPRPSGKLLRSSSPPMSSLSTSASASPSAPAPGAAAGNVMHETQRFHTGYRTTVI